MALPTRVSHTCYRIGDIDRSVAFYTCLGFREIERLDLGGGATNVYLNIPGDGDDPKLELTFNEGQSSYELGSGYSHIALDTPDLDATITALKADGITPDSEPYAVDGYKLCFVRDPDGYRIEIVQPPAPSRN